MNQQWRNGEFNPTHGMAAGTIESVTTPWPTPKQMAQELAWTAHVPRPVAGTCEGYLLAGRQQLWVEHEQSALPMRRVFANEARSRNSRSARVAPNP